MFDLTLSLDNGPEPGATPRVLEILAARGVKTTFFVIGDAYCSTFTELAPGDVIVTGTTGGVGALSHPAALDEGRRRGRGGDFRHRDLAQSRQGGSRGECNARGLTTGGQ